jgi:4-hydroxybenzoate polyprenyltransferase
MDENVTVPDVLFGQAAPIERTFVNKFIGFVAMQRLMICFMILPIAAAPYALAGGQVDAQLVLFLLVAFLVIIATNIINDLTGIERDKKKWPLRPLPTGLLSPRLMTAYVLILSVVALAIAGVVFNWVFMVGVFLLIAFATTYATYSRDKIGHLTAVLPIAPIPAVAWSAASPGTVFTPLPWLLVLITVPLAILSQLFNEERIPGKSLFVMFKPSTNRALCIAAGATMLLVGAVITLYVPLAWPFMAVVTAYAIWALVQARHFGKPNSVEKLTNAFRVYALWNCVLWGTAALLAWIK